MGNLFAPEAEPRPAGIVVSSFTAPVWTEHQVGIGRNTGRNRSGKLERRYGFFRCTNCNSRWESSHAYCTPGTDEAVYKQECKKCNTGYFPYKVEPIKCSMCGSTDCSCDRSNRHVDASKPHRSDLCQKCRAGNPCLKSAV